VFYISIVLHSHVKSYNIYIFYIYIVFLDRAKLYKYIYFHTYTECKSQTIYMHNTGTTNLQDQDRFTKVKLNI